MKLEKFWRKDSLHNTKAISIYNQQPALVSNFIFLARPFIIMSKNLIAKHTHTHIRHLCTKYVYILLLCAYVCGFLCKAVCWYVCMYVCAAYVVTYIYVKNYFPNSTFAICMVLTNINCEFPNTIL